MSDLMIVLAAVGAVFLVLWAAMRRLDPPALVPVPVFELHPADVWHARYLTEQAMTRGLRATARRTGALTLPAAALLTEDHADGALSVWNEAERRRRQDRLFASYGQPFRRFTSRSRT